MKIDGVYHVILHLKFDRFPMHVQILSWLILSWVVNWFVSGSRKLTNSVCKFWASNGKRSLIKKSNNECRHASSPGSRQCRGALEFVVVDFVENFRLTMLRRCYCCRCLLWVECKKPEIQEE